MSLEKQTVGVPLLGLNTVADQKSAAAGEFDLIENMWFNRTARGGAELRKRYGGSALGRSTFGSIGTIASGTRLATYGNERLMAGGMGVASDPGSLWSYNPKYSNWKQVGFVPALGQGAMPSFGVTAEIIGSSKQSYDGPDVAVSPDGTLLCMVWKDAQAGGGVFMTYVTVIDLVTGDQLISSRPLDNVAGINGWARVVALANVFVILTANISSPNILGRTYTYATAVLSGTTSLSTNLNATGKADVIKNPNADEFWIAHQRSGTNDLIIRAFTGALVANGTNTSGELPSQAIGFLNWDASNTRMYLAIVSAAAGAKLIEINSATLGIVSTTVMDAAVTSAANATGYVTAGPVFTVFIEVRAASASNNLVRLWPGSGATSVFQRSVGLAAQIIKQGTRYYLPVLYDSTLQAGYYLLDVTRTDFDRVPVVLRMLYGLGGSQPAQGTLGACGAISSTVVGIPALKLMRNPLGTKLYSACLLRVDFAATSISGAKRLGEDLHMCGGLTKVYDGGLSTEHGFLVFPEAPTLSQGAGGSATLLGTYQVCVVYNWADSRGQVHRSAPSPAASITLTGANQQIGVTYQNLRLTAKQSANTGASVVGVEVYRTVAGGTTFFLNQEATNVDTADTNLLPTIGSVSDTTLSANEILYTTGGVRPRLSAPAARLMEAWRNRLFLAGTENPNELWVSNEYSPGLGGVSFSDTLVLQLESDGGPITALCEMDDRLVIFKRNAIYVLSGNGPALTGDNQYQPPVRLTATIGAVEQRGVVKTRDGVMFKSTRGIFLLAHNGATLYVGAGVESFNALTVTGACVLEDEEQVRFVTATGTTLVYHYGLPDEQGIGRWTTFTGQAAVDCIMWNGKFARLASDGTVTEETVGAYTDPGGATINAKARLCWLNLTQFFGRFRLYGIQLLGDLLASFTLTHRIAYDYDATVIESETKAVTVATPLPLQLSPARRRAVAVQVTLEETSTTQGFQLSGWGLEVGVEPGAAKSGSEKRLT